MIVKMLEAERLDQT